MVFHKEGKNEALGAYTPALAEMWGDFIDWEKRREGEGGFLERTLKAHGCFRVLNAALGDGCDSIHLTREGFDVVSNEIDSNFIQKALLNARRDGVTLQITGFDWLDFQNRLPEGSFDAVVLMGNSLTHLFKKKEQLAALAGFRHVLRPGGVLLIDERNYQYLLDNKKEALQNFRYSKKYVYCGEKVSGVPESMKPGKAVFKYTHENGLQGRIQMYPFHKGELEGLLKETGFTKVTKFSDYKRGHSDKADFHQYIAVK